MTDRQIATKRRERKIRRYRAAERGEVQLSPDLITVGA